MASKPHTKSPRTAVIIGAGPAGLTAAYELLERTDIIPIILEASDGVGGISRTYNHNGNRIDLGGHRFFSKSDRVMNWWQNILPIRYDENPEGKKPVRISYQKQSRLVTPSAADAAKDNCLLVRKRVSRILFHRKFFDYPLSLSLRTLSNLGLFNVFLAGGSYLKSRLLPRRPEKTLEDFIINRFGRFLYSAFFRDYTHKVWGVACADIPADWGAQRIKGLSITGLLRHSIKTILCGQDKSTSQKNTETSLIERFLYPAFGPGHMWERVADLVREKGGKIEFGKKVTMIEATELSGGSHISAVRTEDTITGKTEWIRGDFFFSTMPLKKLIEGFSPQAPENVLRVAGGLPYRDFMTVGLLAKRLRLSGGITSSQLGEKLPDNWIYVQEPDVRVGRIQVFNNWSPFLVADPGTIWLGLEYFLNETDALWKADNTDIVALGISEMEKLGFLVEEDVIDSVVIRQKKAYPAYFGTYGELDVIRNFLGQFMNLFPLGRNGQHRYNNQDHSMLTAMVAIDGIADGKGNPESVWQINLEEEYLEEK